MRVALLACAGALGATIVGGRAAAQSRAELFAPAGVTGGNVYRGAFTPDGRAMYFFRKVGSPNREEYRIFRTRLVGGVWTTPDTVRLGAGEHSDLYPTLSSDGTRMVFTSYRPAPGIPQSAAGAHLWYVDASGDGWGEPVFVEASRPGHYHAQPQLLRDGSLVFKRITPDWRIPQQFVSRWDGRAYAMPRPLPVYERWISWRDDAVLQEAVLAPDQSYALLLVARRAGNRSEPPDIWVTFRDTAWSEPRLLGASVNTEGTENFPFFSPDGATLFFVRDFNAFYRVDVEAAIGGARRP